MDTKLVTALLFSGLSWGSDLPICASATDLATLYEHDKSVADAKYKGKLLLVKGSVHHIRSGGREVDLKSDSLSLVRCSGADFSSLRAGQQVTLRCKGDGTSYPLTVSACAIVSPQTACWTEAKPPLRRESPTFVELTLAPQLQGQSVLISGTTNLKDGAIISYEVEHELFAKGIAKLFVDGNVVVKNGRYSATAAVNGWPRGKINVWVGFQTILGTRQSQPPWVKVQYGEMGQKMEGATVKLAGAGLKRAELQKTVSKP